MNQNDTDRTEGLLRGLSLRQPPDRLDRRVRSAIAVRRIRRTRVAVVAAAASAVAAGLLVVFLLNPGDGNPDGGAETAHSPDAVEPVPPPQPAPPTPPKEPIDDPPMQPVYIEQLWSAPAAGEVVIRDDAPPLQRVHHQVVRHVRWIDERNQVRIEWNIPSEQEVLVPLEYN